VPRTTRIGLFVVRTSVRFFGNEAPTTNLCLHPQRLWRASLPDTFPIEGNCGVGRVEAKRRIEAKRVVRRATRLVSIHSAFSPSRYSECGLQRPKTVPGPPRCKSLSRTSRCPIHSCECVLDTSAVTTIPVITVIHCRRVRCLIKFLVRLLAEFLPADWQPSRFEQHHNLWRICRPGAAHVARTSLHSPCTFSCA
jgi:hypothetical protein